MYRPEKQQSDFIEYRIYISIKGLIQQMLCKW